MANGNATDPLIDRQNNTFDSFGRLIKVERISAGVRSVSEFVYNGDNFRVTKTVKKSKNKYQEEVLARKICINHFVANGMERIIDGVLMTKHTLQHLLLNKIGDIIGQKKVILTFITSNFMLAACSLGGGISPGLEGKNNSNSDDKNSENKLKKWNSTDGKDNVTKSGVSKKTSAAGFVRDDKGVYHARQDALQQYGGYNFVYDIVLIMPPV